MGSLAAMLLVPLILAAFIYLAIMIAIESFRRSLATVPFKRRMLGLSLVIAYVLLFIGCGVKIGVGGS